MGKGHTVKIGDELWAECEAIAQRIKQDAPFPEAYPSSFGAGDVIRGFVERGVKAARSDGHPGRPGALRVTTYTEDLPPGGPTNAHSAGGALDGSGTADRTSGVGVVVTRRVGPLDMIASGAGYSESEEDGWSAIGEDPPSVFDGMSEDEVVGPVGDR